MESREETTYTPEALEAARRDEERRMVREGTEIWKARKEELLRQKQREQCELRRMLANYWPWGRPGGGAPCASALRKRNVPLEPSDQYANLSAAPSPSSLLHSSRSNQFPQVWRTRSMTHRLHHSKVRDSPDYNSYGAHNDYGAGEAGSRQLDDRGMRDEEEVQVYRLTAGGVELAPLLTSGARGGGGVGGGGKQNQRTQSTRHVATDATRPGYMIDSWRVQNAGSRDYIIDLAEQIRRKQELATEERRREGENCRRHFDTWRRLWGRPGHGAPIDHARRRNNLHDILYRTTTAGAASFAETRPVKSSTSAH